jgi:hypothetical protein
MMRNFQIIWLVRQKALILTCALLKANEKMEKLHNWDTCCDEAKDDAVKIGFKAATCSRTIRIGTKSLE